MNRAQRLGWHSVQVGVHALVAVLLVVVVARAFATDHTPAQRLGVILASLAMAAVYVLGLSPLVRRRPGRAVVWLVVLVACWLAVLVQSPEGVYLAFPLFFLAAHLFGDRLIVVAVGVLTVLAVVGYAAQRAWSFAGVLGPVLGGLVAIATVLGLRAVERESSRRGVLEERERLAREIHDTVTQGLASIQLLLGAAASQLDADPDRAGALIGEARSIATANLEEARRFVRALAPADLEAAALPEALRQVAGDAGAEYELSGAPRPLPTAHDVALLRIAQEALTNIVRHAGASRSRVTLSYLADAVALDVVDDGVGFDPAARRSGFGLESMRSRAAALGGHLDVESAPGSGTAIAVSLPERTS